MQTPISSTDFMKESLRLFTKEQVYLWFEECKKMDSVLQVYIENNLDKFSHNENSLPHELIEEFSDILRNSGIVTSYNLSDLEAYHGYTVFGFPDNKKAFNQANNPDLYYGIAKAKTFGVAHTHQLSDAFNYVLEGEGVFTGDPADEGKFNFYYHGQTMMKDSAFEIPKGMIHGHLVKKDKEIWIFFVQECGFNKNLKCVGDFHVMNDYDKQQFGPYYI